MGLLLDLQGRSVGVWRPGQEVKLVPLVLIFYQKIFTQNKFRSFLKVTSKKKTKQNQNKNKIKTKTKQSKTTTTTAKTYIS